MLNWNARLAVGVAALTIASSGLAADRDRVAPEFGPELVAEADAAIGVTGARLMTVETAGLTPAGPAVVSIPYQDHDITLRLEPHSVRAAGYEVRVQQADGSWTTVVPEAPRTLRGSIDEYPGARVAGALLDDGLYAAIIFEDGEQLWLEAVGQRIGADPTLHATYGVEDIVPHGGSCGMEAIAIQPAPANDAAAGGGFLGPLCVTELATDADVEYFQAYGSVAAVNNRIELIVNTCNQQYESEVGITHELTTQLVRTSEPDPYSANTNNELLCQFVNEWTNNQQSIQRDVAQLFTGKSLQGSVIGQAADLGSICEPQGCTDFPCECGQFGTAGSYSFVESDFNGNFGCAVDLTAHELGHLWNAVHCSCPSNTMNPSITCANTFASVTRADIEAYRDTRPCLDCVGAITFIFPNGLPEFVSPDGGTTVRVEVESGLFTPVPGSGVLNVSVNGGPVLPLAMTELEPNVYDAVFPAATCPGVAEFFFTVDAQEGGTAADPLGAPDTVYAAPIGFGSNTIFEDNFETDQGWSVVNNGLTDGAWNRGVPVGGGDRGDPPTDGDGSGQCYLTDNVDGNSDVDGGSTTLISPVLDASQGEPVISYYRWFHNSFGDNPFTESFLVEVSDDGGATWTVLETVGPGGDEVSGGWFFKQFAIADAGIEVTDQFRIRFTADDFGPAGSVVEAGVDGVQLLGLECDSDCLGDLDGSGDVDPADLASLLSQWGPCGGTCTADFDGDGSVGPADLATLLSAWGDCP